MYKKMTNKCCPKVKEYYPNFEDLLKQRMLDNEKKMKMKNCTKLLNLPGPYQSPTKFDEVFNLVNTALTIDMRVNMGNSYLNTTTYGLLMMIGQAPQCGNFYVWVSAGKINFGVQCNGRGSDDTLKSTTSLVGDKDYDVRVQYDGTIASIYVNGQLDARASKKFNYFSDVEKVVVGAGKSDLSAEVMPSGASISKIIIEGCKEKCENKCKNKCNL